MTPKNRIKGGGVRNDSKKSDIIYAWSLSWVISQVKTQEFIVNRNRLIVTAFVEDLREKFPQICLGHPLKFPTIGQQTTISQNLQQSFGLHQSTISRFFNASKDGDTSGLTNSSRDTNKKELPPGKIQNVKVHTKKKCLHDLQLTQFGGTFTKPFTNP